MKTFTKEEVYYFADFAHIAVGEDEVDTYAKELSVLAKFAERLQEVDVEGVAPLTHPGRPRVNVMREDTPTDILSRDEMLRNAPEHEDGMIKVPNTF